ncbi:MAG: winged helix-turn-helix domain-containing protein [Dysgonamonadaceae bacterium]|nr:winged helix-turn-helix domain-containing protein [Dysgonamonadaceae bacterium]
MKEKIGLDAGRVWSILNEEGAKTVKELKKSSKLTDKEIFAAIGWLAREEKLLFEETDSDICLSLI